MQDCITSPELSDFLQGKLPLPRADEITSHIDDCATCQDTVAGITSEDTFVIGLRESPSESAEPREPAFRHSLQRLLGGIASRIEPVGEPRSIGPYVVDAKLGDGGMGTVFRAQHTKLKRTVALKILPTQRWANTHAIARFEREMEAIGQLDHPNIVRAHDAGEDAGMHYLVMEFIDGLDLSRLVDRIGRLPVPEACELIRQAAIGLQHAHDHGLIHRDLKPSNLMLARGASNGSSAATLKLLDLGLARFGDEHLREDHDVTTVGALMGTLDYMSPEQGIDSHSVDNRADIYGLGATLFKLLSGRAPYADPQYDSLMKKMTALATKTPPSLATVSPHLPISLVQIVDRMIARDPDDRFSSAQAVADALTEAAQGANLGMLLDKGLSAAAPKSQANHQDIVSLNHQLPQFAPASRGAKHRGRGWKPWLIGIGLAAVLLAAGAVYRIATDYGEIVISSASDDLEVVVKQAGEAIDQIAISSGKGSTQVRSGEYQIEVVGKDAELYVQPTSVRVQRRQIAAIPLQSKQIKSPSKRFSSPSRPPADVHVEGVVHNSNRTTPTGSPHNLGSVPRVPRYDNKTLAQWLSDVRFERNPKRLKEAFQATRLLITHPSNASLMDESMDATFQLMRQFGHRAGSQEGMLCEYAWHALTDLPAPMIAERIIQEIPNSNAKSQDFLVQFLMPVVSQSDIQLTNHILAQTKRVRAELVWRAHELQTAMSQLDDTANDWCIEFLYQLTVYEKINPSHWKSARDLFVAGLASQHDSNPIAEFAMWHLVAIEPENPRIVPAAKRVLLDPMSTDLGLYLALRTLDQIDRRDANALDELAQLLGSPRFQIDTPIYGGYGGNGGIPYLFPAPQTQAGHIVAQEDIWKLVLEQILAYEEQASTVVPWLIGGWLESNQRRGPDHANSRCIRNALVQIAPRFNEPVFGTESPRLSVNLFGTEIDGKADSLVVIAENSGGAGQSDTVRMAALSALFLNIDQLSHGKISSRDTAYQFHLFRTNGQTPIVARLPADQRVRGAAFYADCDRMVRNAIAKHRSGDANSPEKELYIDLQPAYDADDQRRANRTPQGGGGMGGGMF